MTDSELDIFNRSYILQARLQMIAHAVGPMQNRTGLCIGTVPAALRARLMALGGEWTFCREQGKLSFDDGEFDRVVILDHLEWVEDDRAFMADVHRVLKAAGLLYTETEHRKCWTFWRPIRRLFRVEDRLAERLRPGYTGSDLFDTLKDGFDLQEIRTYSRFFTEGAETFLRLAISAFCSPASPDDSDQTPDEAQSDALAQQIHTIQSIAYPFYVIAAKLDWLLFFTRGYRLRAVARRRMWRPRRSPVLRDGRSLVDATLNTRIGTAAPF